MKEALLRVYYYSLPLFYFIKQELKQTVWILEAGIDINQKKNEWFAKQDKGHDGQENGVEKDVKRSNHEKVVFMYYPQYYVDVVVINPWLFTIYWRSCFSESLTNFTFNFQLIGENELECFGIFLENINSVDQHKLTEGKGYQNFKRMFSAIGNTLSKLASSSSSTMPFLNTQGTSGSELDSNSLRIKFNSREEFNIFIFEMTKYLILLSFSSKPRGPS